MMIIFARLFPALLHLKSICISHQGGLSTHLLESKDLFELKKLRDKGKVIIYKACGGQAERLTSLLMVTSLGILCRSHHNIQVSSARAEVSYKYAI